MTQGQLGFRRRGVLGLAAGGASEVAFAGIVGRSRAMLATTRYARDVARTDREDVLVVGAPGTGKGLLARAIHYASGRRDEPLVSIDVRGTPFRLLESELFGHDVRSFADAHARKSGVLELAGEGTLLIENVDHLPPRLQPKLVRALGDRCVRPGGGIEEYPVRCRVITCSSRPLEELVAEGRFRPDLFRLLNGARVHVPALKDREDDVILLAEHFHTTLTEAQGLPRLRLGEDAIAALRAYDWPGNIRELRAAMQSAVEVCATETLHARHLSIQKREAAPLSFEETAQIPLPLTGRSLREIEAEAIRYTLDLAGGNTAAAAKALGLTGAALHAKLREHGIEVSSSGMAAS